MEDNIEILRQPLVIDLFPAFNEFKLAEFRISYLNSRVQHTIIGESRLTYSGIPKKLLFQESYYENYPTKNLTILEIPLEENMTKYEREETTRRTLVNYALRHFPNSIYIISDLDEIPSHEQIELMYTQKGSFHFVAPTFYRKLNWALQDWHKDWSYPVITNDKNFSFPYGGRFANLPILNCETQGAHLSYLGFNGDLLSTKYSSFTHTELKLDYVSEEEIIKFSNRFVIDHIGRVRNKGFGILKIQNYSELNHIQNALYSRFPDYSSFESCEFNFFSRLFASSALTLVNRNIKYSNIIYRSIVLKNKISHINFFAVRIFILHEILIALAYNLCRPFVHFFKSILQFKV